MKRAILIAGGTVGGLGAVLSVTPPQLGSNGISTLAGASAATSSTPVVTTSAPAATAEATPQAVATKKATTNTKKPTTKGSTNSSTTNTTVVASTPTPTPTQTPTQTKSTTSGVSGTFTGDAFNVSYGIVQVKITVSSGRITDAVALQAPSGRSQRWSDYAIPNLKSQTLSAQSAAISGVSGASYTSYGWYKSLITALQKAGMSTGV